MFDRHAVAVHRHPARRVGTVVADDLTSENILSARRTARQAAERAERTGEGRFPRRFGAG